MVKLALDDPFEVIREALDAAGCEPSGEYVIRSRCPHHRGGSRDSLKVSRGDRHPVVFVCFRECKPGEVLSALGLTWFDVCHPLPATNRVEVRAKGLGDRG